jgi:hypothetical protein
MARNKNSTALFDVIHAAKKPPKSSPSASIPAPRWWGKDKKPLKAASVADPTENVGKQQSWLTAARRNGGAAAPAPVVAETPSRVETQSRVETPLPDESAESAGVAADELLKSEVLPEAEPAAPRMRFIDRFKARAAQPAPVAEESASVESAAETSEPQPSSELAESSLPAVYSSAEQTPIKLEPKPSRERASRDSMVAIDRASGDIRFHLSYGGLVAIGFIFVMALAIAFIAGTRSAATTSAEADPADAKVVHTNTNAPSTSGLAMAVGPAKSPDADRHMSPDVLDVSPKSPRPSPVVSSTPVATPAPLPVKATRDIGMMYVVIQSYPDQELAQKACDFVNRAGVPCTLVQGLSGWAMRDWYSVVGLQPFKKRDPGLDEYERAITALGLKFSNKIYNQFQPQGYTWRADSDAAAE